MGQIEIRFRMNLKTGKKDLLIDFESDEDAMRHEHERDHRRVIERLVGQGVLQPDEVGEVVVQRKAPGQPTAAPAEQGPEAQASGQ